MSLTSTRDRPVTLQRTGNIPFTLSFLISFNFYYSDRSQNTFSHFDIHPNSSINTETNMLKDSEKTMRSREIYYIYKVCTVSDRNRSFCTCIVSMYLYAYILLKKVPWTKKCSQIYFFFQVYQCYTSYIMWNVYSSYINVHTCMLWCQYKSFVNVFYRTT